MSYRDKDYFKLYYHRRKDTYAFIEKKIQDIIGLLRKDGRVFAIPYLEKFIDETLAGITVDLVEEQARLDAEKKLIKKRSKCIENLERLQKEQEERLLKIQELQDQRAKLQEAQ